MGNEACSAGVMLKFRPPERGFVHRSCRLPRTLGIRRDRRFGVFVALLSNLLLIALLLLHRLSPSGLFRWLPRAVPQIRFSPAYFLPSVLAWLIFFCVLSYHPAFFLHMEHFLQLFLRLDSSSIVCLKQRRPESPRHSVFGKHAEPGTPLFLLKSAR